MKVNKIYESFRNNVMCRNDSTQHAANVLWNDLKNHLPIDKRKEFEIEWSHYMSGELNNDEFGAYIKELKQHLGHGY